MRTAKQLCEAAEQLMAAARECPNEIVREALEKASSEVAVKMADQLQWELAQAKKCA